MLQYYESLYVVDTLWAQLLLQFWTDPFETLQVFKIYMCFLQNPLVMFFITFFHIFNLDFFAWFRVCSQNLVSATPPTVLTDRSFWNFTGILIMVWRYACAFYRILK